MNRFWIRKAKQLFSNTKFLPKKLNPYSKKAVAKIQAPDN